MTIGEVFLGSFLSVLFDRLASPQLWDFARREGIDSRLIELKKKVPLIGRLLNDAENKQITDPDVNNWLEDLRDWAFDADDLLDEILTKALRRQLDEEANTISSDSMVQAFTQTVHNISQHFNPEMGSKIAEIYDRLQDIYDQKDLLGLETATDSHIPRARETTAHMFHTEVFGRDDDKNKIIAQLRSGDKKLGVISIVGMGGVGKTTLARYIFHDQSIQSHFDLIAWVFVSHDSSVKGITKGILQSLDCQVPDPSSLDQLQSKLIEKLKGQKFLIVLDDVWNIGFFDWSDLRAPFAHGDLGSKILVTTRDQKVASVVGNIGSHALKGLSSGDCWSVFIQNLLDNDNATTAHESFRQKIVDKCKGVPLVAKSVAGLLRNKPLGREWDDVLDSEIWNLSDDGSGILPALRLSYIHLPMNLKRCFSFCAVIPKGYKFEEREFVLLWMAEGLIPENGKMQMEELGHEYFQELVSRSFFESFERHRQRHDRPLFIMHDLINDLAEFTAGKTCLKLTGSHIESTRFQKARYLSFLANMGDKQHFQGLENAKFLRCFLPILGPMVWQANLSNYVPFLLPKWQCIRVLSLGYSRVPELPEGIGDLIHLRYLNLCQSVAIRLPDSACNLCNLQTLLLKGCIYLRTLPAGLGKLRNLRHIDCLGCPSLQDMGGGTQKLTELRTLSNFIIGEGRDQGIGQLSSLKHLMGSMTISKLENVVDIRDATEAGLVNKQRLEGLELCWGKITRRPVQDAKFEFEITTELKPYTNLENLRIDGYGGYKFPDWIGEAAFSRMRSVILMDCEKCKQLPPLGKLPSLKKLRIENLPGVERIGEEFYGGESLFSTAFPLLARLTLVGLRGLVEWWCPSSSGGGFGSLRQLYIGSCPSLEWWCPCSSGGGFGSLRQLYVRECPSLVGELPAVESLGTLEIDNKCGKLLASLKLPSINTPWSRGLKIIKSGGEAVGKKTESSWRMRLGGEGVDMEEAEVVECFNKTDDAATRKLLSLVTDLEITNGDVAKIVGVLASNDMTRTRKIVDSTTSLEIYDLCKLTYLPAGSYLRGLENLRELRITGCEELRWVWRTEEMQHQPSAYLHSLRLLEVSWCDQFIGLVEQKEDDDDPVWHCCRLPNGLEVLIIKGCPKVENLPLQNLTSLRSLELFFCWNLSCLIPDATTQFPSALKELTIKLCPSLARLSLPASLEKLVIMGCGKLESLELLYSPPASSLKIVDLWDCRNLKSLPVFPPGSSIKIR